MVWPPTPVPTMVAVRIDKRHVEGDRSLRNRFARRHHRELRDAVEGGNLPLVEMLERIEILDLGGDLLAEFLRLPPA